jgi:hypothetical protein
MVHVARSKNLRAWLFVADMSTFALRAEFDVFLCLFSPIA